MIIKNEQMTTAEAILAVHEDNVETGKTILNILFTGALLWFIGIPVALGILSFFGYLVLWIFLR
jgi:hypothetical protein